MKYLTIKFASGLLIVLLSSLLVLPAFAIVNLDQLRNYSFKEKKQKQLANLPKKEFNCNDAQDTFVPGQVVIKYKVVPEQPQVSSYRTISKGRNFSLKKLANNSKVATDFFNKIYLVTDEASFQNFKARQVIENDDCQNVLQMIEDIKQDPNVELAEPNLIYKSMATVNDPLLNSSLNPPGLWGLKRIDVETAWNISQGSGVVVAVIDSGVDWNHPDLLSNIPLVGYDFIHKDKYPEDGTGHGTHVAGTIAAVGNNGKGGVGVAYKSKIFPIRILDETGRGSSTYSSDLIAALNQASFNNAKVINLSLGTLVYSQLFDQAYDQLYKSGIAILAASGNSGVNELNYPAAYTSVMAVGSTSANDQVSDFSNYGTWVDVAAPGEDILSTFSYNILSTCRNAGSDACLDQVIYSEGTTYGYALSDGTSMATPHVSGLAALLYSYDDSLTVDDVLGIIAVTTDPINTNKEMGGGRINAASALGYALAWRCFKAVDTNQDGTFSDSELLNFAAAYNRAYQYYDRRLDVNNNGIADDSDRDSFRNIVIATLDPALEKSFNQYLNALFAVDLRLPYGLVSLQERNQFKKKIFQTIKKKKYVAYLDINLDGTVSYDDYYFTLNVLQRLGL